VLRNFAHRTLLQQLLQGEGLQFQVSLLAAAGFFQVGWAQLVLTTADALERQHRLLLAREEPLVLFVKGFELGAVIAVGKRQVQPHEVVVADTQLAAVAAEAPGYL